MKKRLMILSRINKFSKEHFDALIHNAMDKGALMGFIDKIRGQV